MIIKKLALLLKLITKITYYEEIIAQKINFINKDYKIQKNELLTKIRETNNEVIRLSAKVEKLKLKEKETLFEIEQICQKLKTTQNKNNKQKEKYKEKLETLEIFLKDFEDEIFELKECLMQKLNEYSIQVDDLKITNKKLEKLLIEKANSDLDQDKYKGEIMRRRVQIAEKYRNIKECVNKLNENDNQKTRLFNTYIQKINNTLDIKEYYKPVNTDMDLRNEIIKKMEYLKKQKANNSSSRNIPSKTKSFNLHNSQLSYLNNSTRRIDKDNSGINKTEIMNELSLDLKLEDLSYTNPNVKYGVRQNINNKKQSYKDQGFNTSSIKNSIHNLKHKTNYNQYKTNTMSSLRGSHSFDNKKLKKSTNKSNYSIENISDNSYEPNLVIRNEKDDILNESSFKIKVKFRIELCSPEEFTTLEAIRPLLEGTIIYKRMNIKKLQEYNPLEANYPPENVGFETLFMNLDKSLRMFTFTREDLATNTEIFFEKIEKIEVSKNTKNIENIRKVYKNLEKQSINPEEYFNSMNSNVSSLFNENYRSKCLNANYYTIFIYLKSGIKVEIIYTTYEDFKAWKKGFYCLISNKSKLALLKGKII